MKRLPLFVISIMAFSIALVAAFLIGRATRPESTAVGAHSHVYTARLGDVVRVPGAATRCAASQEGGFMNFFCERTPSGRYEVVFYSDSVFVSRIGNPDRPPAYVARWKR